MAELEDVTLDGKPLHSLRVADLKAALEQRGLAKSGQKNALIKRLKGALMLESLQRTSTSHAGLQPNSQIGEEMSQNSFIKQYLAKQQELLRQRMEREAREAAEADDTDSPAGPEEDDHRAANDSASYLPDKHHVASRPSVPEDGGGDLGGSEVALGVQRQDAGTPSGSHESTDVPKAKIWRPSFSQEEVATPSPPRAVASLSVRVVGQPERQGVPLIVPRPLQREGTAPIEAGPAHPMPQLGQSARTQEDSDEDDDDDDDDDSDEDDNWGPLSRGRKNIHTPPAQRSRRKLQPPQHIPPHHSPLQLRQPTPPPSPPPELSFPLPDTPKQSPPEHDEPEAPEGAAVSSPVPLQRQESSSSSRSSSPEPPTKRRPGPLSLLVRKMESEGAFDGGQKKDEEEEGDATVAAGEHAAGSGVLVFSREATDNVHTSCDSKVVPDQDSPQEKLPEESGSLPTIPSVGDSGPLESVEMEEVKGNQKNMDDKEKKYDMEVCGEEKEREKEAEESFNASSWKRERVESPARDSADLHHASPPPSPPAPAKRARMFSEVPPPECLMSPSKPEQVSVLVSGPQHANADDKMETEAATASPQSSLDKEHKHCEETNDMETDLQEPAGVDDVTEDINKPPSTLPSPPLEEMAAERERKSSKENERKSSTERHDKGSAERDREMFPEREGKRSAEREGGIATERESEISAERAQSTEKDKEISAERKKSTERKRQRSTEREKSPERHSPSSQSSSSDSDSDSESSSSSSSGSSPQDKPRAASQNKDKEKKAKSPDDAAEEKEEPLRDVKQATVAEPTGPVSMELQEQPESESALSHPASKEAPETSESRSDESTTPKAFAARKISLTTAKPEGATVEVESGGGAGRKRRWGSSTAVTAKKPSISITTESLKSLIPDLKPLQEAVVDLHPDEGHFSGDEDSGQQPERDEDQGLQIRRTVTQVVPAENQENGQKEKEEEEEDEEDDDEEEQPEVEKEKPIKKQRRESSSEVAMETQEGDTKKVTPNDSVVRRSISQQKVAVSITIDDPVRTGRQLSPPRGKTSNIIHVCNLVRPFTLGQLKELLNRTGTVVEDGFWIDKIKSHCYVTYASLEEAVATREALHGVKWPSSNPKVLRVDFCEQKELDFHKGLLTGEDPRAAAAPNRPVAPPPLMPPTREKEREREKEGAVPNVRDQWAEREREMERRERTRSEREWDRDKVRDFSRDEREAGRRSRSRDRDRRRKERGKSKEKKSEKKDNKPEEPPAKLLDDLFRKTKAAPCIYWLPLTEEQATQKNLERAERMKEREKRRKELQEEEDKKREEERKERARGRERDGGNAASSGGGSGRPTEGEKDKERERERERERGREKEGEKRRDGNRGRGSDSKPAGGSRRSRSHSNPSRDRRR